MASVITNQSRQNVTVHWSESAELIVIGAGNTAIHLELAEARQLRDDLQRGIHAAVSS